MKVRQYTLNSPTDIDSLADVQLSFSPQLILVFGAPEFFASALLHQRLREHYPQAQLAGCSGSGEIQGSRCLDNACVLSFVAFDEGEVRGHSEKLQSMDDSEDAGARLGRQLDKHQLRGLLVYGPGVAINGSALVKGIQRELGAEIPLSGGLAGDNGKFEHSWTLGNEGISENHIQALAIYGAGIEIHTGTFAGWEAFGPSRKVTRAQGNILYELDREPALAIYKRYLGDYARDLPGIGLLFPFEILSDTEDQHGIIRTILGIDEEEQSLILAGNVDDGDRLRLMHSGIDSLVAGAASAAQMALKERNLPQEQSLALLVSCIGRKLVLSDLVDEELEAVTEILGAGAFTTGFYSNGEIACSSDNGQCQLHNQTMTICWICEP